MQQIIRKATPDDIPVIRNLAWTIWPIAYSNMISKAQMEYMLEWMYSDQALQEQMRQGHQFLLLTEANDESVGYTSFRNQSDQNWKLEKLYVLPAKHRGGRGRALLERVMEEIRCVGGKNLELQVNRNNPAVGFYRKLGFEVLRDEDFDIGNGFYMNDHIMGRNL